MASAERSASASYYDGSRRFLWISEKTGLPLDQLNFAVIQVFALLMAFVLRYHLHPNLVTPTRRHIFSAVIGVYMVYFCHGRETIHVIILTVVCYLIMRFTSPKYVQRIVLFAALTYLSLIQILRVKYFYGSYILDITGPMMLATQKVTSLAFSLHDGICGNEKTLNPNQQKLAIKELPSPIQFFSYMFHFQTVLCGPLAMYSDYIKFIEGWHYSYMDNSYGRLAKFGDKKIVPEPSSVNAVLRKLLAAVILGMLVLVVTPLYPVHRLKDDEFVLHTSIFTQTWILLMTTMAARFKYYHAWLIADAITNASGFGFNGYTYDGFPKWDLISNVDILKFEFSISFRDSMENWNKGTMRWLRYISYERAPFQKTLVTYLLSAVWHGFYPGYYITFGSAALLTVAARHVRNCIRPFFQGSFWTSSLYNIITFIVTKIGIAYIVFPFLLLELEASVYLYKHMNFYFHVICFICIYFLPLIFIYEPKFNILHTVDTDEHIEAPKSNGEANHKQCNGNNINKNE